MSISLSNKDKLALISNLATMLSAGIPILEAIDTLLEESKGNMRKILLLLRDSLNEGKPISYAFSLAPRVFDPVVINLLKAAEEAGTLEESLKDLTKSIKNQMAFNDHLKSSLTYPLFVLGVFVFILVVILTFVVPRIGKVFGGLRVPLPPATQFLIAVSDFFIGYWPHILAGLVVLIILTVMLYRVKKRAFINAFLRLPGLSSLGQMIDLTRFTHSMGLLLHAGIPVAEALELAKNTVVKKDMLKVVKQAQADVTAGKSLADGMRRGKKIIPPIMIRTIETAERSGTLEATMKEMGEYFEEQVNHRLKTVTTLIEPILLVVIGLLVGGMMLAVIAPIYSLITQINTR
jgi:type II secretory pathway component PulF